jgi:hypothetical protein
MQVLRNILEDLFLFEHAFAMIFHRGLYNKFLKRNILTQTTQQFWANNPLRKRLLFKAIIVIPRPRIQTLRGRGVTDSVLYEKYFE